MIEGAEFFVIFLVALVVFGPQRLPEMARKLGGWTAELRKAARELRQGLEAEVGDVKELADEFRQPMREVEATVRDTKKSFDEEMSPKPWVGPKPLSGPTPEDAMRDLEQIQAAGEAITDAAEPSLNGSEPSVAAADAVPDDQPDGEESPS